MTKAKVPPVRVIRAATAVRSALQRLTGQMVPPEVGLLELTSGLMSVNVLYAVARLRIADVLVAGPQTVAEIAARTNTDPDAVGRLLRAAAPYGLVTELPGQRFADTKLAGKLRSDTPDSIRPVVMMIGDPRYQAVWSRLPEAIESGKSQAAEVLGSSMMEVLDSDPEFAAIFDQAMDRLTTLDWPTVEAVYDFSQFGRIADLGGGMGQQLALILRAAPAATGVLVERPSVVDAARTNLGRLGVLDRCRVYGGSFFESVPDDADLYLIRRVIHDFDDEPAIRLLQKVASEMPGQARVLILESVVPPGNTAHFAKQLDLDMLVFVDGRERTEAEFRALLARAGLRLARVIPTISTISLIEAVKA